MCMSYIHISFYYIFKQFYHWNSVYVLNFTAKSQFIKEIKVELCWLIQKESRERALQLLGYLVFTLENDEASFVMSGDTRQNALTVIKLRHATLQYHDPMDIHRNDGYFNKSNSLLKS